MLLTRLFNHVMSNSLKLSNDRYSLYDRVMLHLAPHYERKTRKDYSMKRGRPFTSTSTSSSSTFDHPSSSHHVDEDDDGNGEATSSSPSPPNAPSKTPSTKETSTTFGTTTSSFESKPHSSPPSLRNTPSPQPTNPFLDDPLYAPQRPSNPLPLQIHPSLDITLSLSPITPLDHMFETPSPPPSNSTTSHRPSHLLQYS
nr:cytochrome P450 [Tanacetum cinerariifolium]